MGLLEEHQFREDSRRAMSNMLEINKNSIFTKKVSLDYEIHDNNSMLYFNSLNNKNYSFQMHYLEIGEKEAMHWSMAAQGDEVALFNGNVNRFYNLGFGYLRGFMETKNDNHLMGLVVRGNRVMNVLTQENILLYQANLINAFEKSREQIS